MQRLEKIKSCFTCGLKWPRVTPNAYSALKTMCFPRTNAFTFSFYVLWCVLNINNVSGNCHVTLSRLKCLVNLFNYFNFGISDIFLFGAAVTGKCNLGGCECASAVNPQKLFTVDHFCPYNVIVWPESLWSNRIAILHETNLNQKNIPLESFLFSTSIFQVWCITALLSACLYTY